MLWLLAACTPAPPVAATASSNWGDAACSIAIEFARPMRDRALEVGSTPPMEGVWSWATPTRACFAPTVPPQGLMTYRLGPIGARAEDGGLVEPAELTVDGPPGPVRVGVYAMEDYRAATVAADPAGTRAAGSSHAGAWPAIALGCDLCPAEDDLRARITLIGPDEAEVPLRPATDEERYRLGLPKEARAALVRPEEPLFGNAPYAVTVRGGTCSGSEVDCRAVFRTFPPLEVLPTAEPCGKAICLTTTTPVEPTRLANWMVEVKPAVDRVTVGVDPRPDRLVVRGAFRPGTTYEVHVVPVIGDIFGQTLARDAFVQVTMPASP